MKPPVPPFDPLGMPLEGALILGLAYLTLTLHLLAMNFTLGSVVLLLVSLVRRRTGAARFLGTGLPLGFSYLVTFGVPPLLFVQVVYGQFFYSSSVLIGAFWIAVIPLIVIGYGAAYLHRLTRDARPRPQPLVVGATLLCMLAIGFIYVNNLTLAMTPDRWLGLYRAHPGGGTLNLGEPTLVPRYLLFLSPALAVAGLALVLRGVALARWGRAADGRASQVLGFRAFLVGAGLEAVAAGALLGTLPDGITRLLRSGGTLTVLAALAAALGLAALVLTWLSVGRRSLGRPLAAAVALFGAMGSLVVVRDLVRHEYLRPYFDLGAVTVKAQWGMFAIFAVALVAGLAFLLVLTLRVVPGLARARREELGAGQG